MIEHGTWPHKSPQYAFVDGAKWGRFKATGFTSFPAEIDEAEKEAVKRYGEPEDSKFRTQFHPGDLPGECLYEQSGGTMCVNETHYRSITMEDLNKNGRLVLELKDLCGEAAIYIEEAAKLLDDEPISDIIERLRTAAGMGPREDPDEP